MAADDGDTAATPASEGMFGNSTAPTMAPLPDLPEDALECEVGVFCESMDPDPDDCGSLTLEGDVEVVEKPGNVLLVFDRSGSMDQDWNGQARWQAAGTAIDNALAPLADKLTVGSVFFPSPDPGTDTGQCIDPTGIACIFVPDLTIGSGTCAVNQISAEDQIDFTLGPDFLTQLTGGGGGGGTPKYAPVGGGRTPLSEGLAEAQLALQSATLDGEVTVVVITDGAPNCGWDEGLATQIITDWQAAGIKTYVVGLPGVDADAEGILNRLASAGGTNMYLTPNDAATLEQELINIVQETVSAGFDSCTINLDPAAEVPDKLHLVVSEGGDESAVPHVYDNGEDAWTISDDGSVVELLGDTCTAATDGIYTSIRFEFGCVELPPAMPPRVD